MKLSRHYRRSGFLSCERQRGPIPDGNHLYLGNSTAMEARKLIYGIEESLLVFRASNWHPPWPGQCAKANSHDLASLQELLEAPAQTHSSTV